MLEFEGPAFDVMHFLAEFCNGNLMRNATGSREHFQLVDADVSRLTLESVSCEVDSSCSNSQHGVMQKLTAFPGLGVRESAFPRISHC